MPDPQSTPGSLFMVVAPSGAGKSTLVNALLAQEPDIKLSISYTTRNPRPGEQDGREYFFVTVEEFMAMRLAGEFLESAEVHGNYYGTSRTRITDHMKGGTDVLLEIDWQGAQQVKKQFPHAIGNGTTTRSPGLRFFTAGPTSTTSPMNSCPRMSPLSIVGIKPL